MLPNNRLLLIFCLYVHYFLQFLYLYVLFFFGITYHGLLICIPFCVFLSCFRFSFFAVFCLALPDRRFIIYTALFVHMWFRRQALAQKAQRKLPSRTAAPRRDSPPLPSCSIPHSNANIQWLSSTHGKLPPTASLSHLSHVRVRGCLLSERPVFRKRADKLLHCVNTLTIKPYSTMAKLKV